MVKIFVSYNRVDTDMVKKFADLLGYGCDVWYDQSPSGIIGGEDWWKRIIGEIEQREHFVYLLSPESVNSEWCVKELDKSIELGKNVIPVIIRPRTELPEKIKNLHAIRADEEKILADGISRVYGAILKNSKFEALPKLTESHRQADLRLLKKYWEISSIPDLRRIAWQIDNYDGSFDFIEYGIGVGLQLIEYLKYPETNFHDNRLHNLYHEILDLMDLLEHSQDTEDWKPIENKTENLINKFIDLLRANYPEFSVY